MSAQDLSCPSQPSPLSGPAFQFSLTRGIVQVLHMAILRTLVLTREPPSFAQLGPLPWTPKPWEVRWWSAQVSCRLAAESGGRARPAPPAEMVWGRRTSKMQVLVCRFGLESWPSCLGRWFTLFLETKLYMNASCGVHNRVDEVQFMFIYPIPSH